MDREGVLKTRAGESIVSGYLVGVRDETARVGLPGGLVEVMSSFEADILVSNWFEQLTTKCVGIG